jgi:hypothetical protein
MERYIVANFAYGTGPYLRTTELGIAFNDELEKRGRRRMGIIVPWVYGEKQKRVMREEFARHAGVYPHEILLDKKLGAYLKTFFYGDNSYREALANWVETEHSLSPKISKHLSGSIDLETLYAEKVVLSGKDIKVELSRSPRLSFGIRPAYFTSFAYVGEILERARGVGQIAVSEALLEEGIAVANRVEREQTLRCIAYPATFSFIEGSPGRYAGEILTPPIISTFGPNQDDFHPGIFVTVTGIPGLERLYADAKRLGLRLYSNDTDALPAGGVYASPRAIPNKNMVLQFARAGWSSIWISMMCGTPLVVPDYDPKDDPEIYFNNLSVEALGLGVIYRGQALGDILREAGRIKESYKKINREILDRWGTLDGNRYCAKLFADDFLKRGE